MTGRLQFKGINAPSMGRKSLLMAALVVAVLASAWLMLLAPPPTRLEGNLARQVILLTCCAVYAGRVALMLSVFLKRRPPWWEIVLGCTFFPLVILYFACAGGESDRPLNLIDAIGVVLYLSGSYLSTASEWRRHVWKSRPEHKGHLYTEGLFARCRHINYFGDLVLFSGFALLTQDLWSLLVPLIMLTSFVVMVIPAHDKYLADRYGEEFRAYASRARRLVPFVY